VTQKDDAELIAEVEEAKARLRISLRKSRALVAAYRARLGGARVPGEDDPKDRPIFRFRR
jgi:hypothetical protein